MRKDGSQDKRMNGPAAPAPRGRAGVRGGRRAISSVAERQGEKRRVSNHNPAQIKEVDEILKAAAYPEAPLILWHWGSVDAPEWKEFNGDPEVVKNLVINPQRVIVPAPGEGYCLKRLPEQAGL